MKAVTAVEGKKLLPGLSSARLTYANGEVRFMGILLGKVDAPKRKFEEAKLDAGVEKAYSNAKTCTVTGGEQCKDMKALAKAVADVFGAVAEVDADHHADVLIVKRTAIVPYSPDLPPYADSTGTVAQTRALATELNMDRSKLRTYVQIIGHLGLYLKVDAEIDMVSLWIVDLSVLKSMHLKPLSLEGAVARFGRKFNAKTWTEVELA